MPSRYDEYLQLLKTNFRPAIRLEWLNPDGTAYGEITNDYVDMSGTLTVGMENGTRRTASITLANIDGNFSIEANSIWYGSMVKLWMGLYLSDGTPYYLPQGVFYVTAVQETNTPALRQITLTLTDKWCMLDGTLWGNLDGIYIVPIGSNVYDAIKTLLETSRFTGVSVHNNSEPITNAVDPVAPMFSSYYIGKTYTDSTVDPPKTYNTLEVPYEVRLEYGQTYADVLLELATIIGAYIYYDVDGRLTIEPTQDDITDMSKPILWTFTPDEQEFMSDDSVHDFSSFYNDIMVIGYITNGKQAKGRAQNRNPSSPTSVPVIGLKTYHPYQNTAYYTDEQCQELAEYYLKRQTIKQRSVTIISAPMYHLRENRLIECIRPYTHIEEPLLVSGISMPIGSTGSMTITATSVNEFNFDASIGQTFNVTSSEEILNDWRFEIDKPFIDKNIDTITIYCRNDDWESGAKTFNFTASGATVTAVGGSASASPAVTPQDHMGYWQVNITNVTDSVVVTITSIT